MATIKICDCCREFYTEEDVSDGFIEPCPDCNKCGLGECSYILNGCNCESHRVQYKEEE